MTREFLTTLCSLGLAFGLTSVGASSAVAAEAFDYTVLTKKRETDGRSALVTVGNGDILLSGDSFKVEVVAHKRGDLDISLRTAQGLELSLARGRPMAKGEKLSLNWGYLDHNAGLHRLEISFTGEDGRDEAEHLIRQVADDFLTVPNRLASEAALASADRSLRKAPDEAAGSAGDGLIEALASLPASLSAYRTVLERVQPEQEQRIRGAKEVELYKLMAPGVVLVVTDRGVGSGTVISDDGQIITNWHVVDQAQDIGIIFKPALGRDAKPSEVYAGRVEKVDQVQDLALVRVLDPPEAITVLELGEMEEIPVGSDVHAIGHPRGERWTYTKGIVSQVRSDYQWPNEQGFMHKAMVIQTQTPISPGSSGSPLISDGRRIVGINSFKKEGESLNFAVSVANIREFLEAPSKVQPPAVASVCDPRRTRYDSEGDGRLDRELVDTDCDGKVDLVKVDEDQDGTPDFVLADRNGDGKPDLKIVSTGKDGEFDLWLFDSDGDGRLDMVGHNRNRDGLLERYVRG